MVHSHERRFPLCRACSCGLSCTVLFTVHILDFKYSWFDKVIIANFKHYDHFYLLLTYAIIRLLGETIDVGLLAFPLTLLEQVKQNKGSALNLIVYDSLICFNFLTSLTSLTS